MAVEVVHFNPMRRRPGLLGRVLPRRPLNNFGDLLGPALVARIVQERGLVEPDAPRRLLAVGSIMKMSRPGDTVWGAGVNGKSMDAGGAPDLDVRAVRGPRTRDLLRDLGMTVGDVFGDPALLWPRYFSRDWYLEHHPAPRREVAVVPNFHDRDRFSGAEVVDPLGDPHAVITQIAHADFVCGSSLHGVVLAEAFGIPARLIRPGAEPAFKYDDYYGGTGRASHAPADDIAGAKRLGGEPPAVIDADGLLAAFPADLWAPRSATRE